MNIASSPFLSTDFIHASFGSTSFFCTSASSESFIVTMPAPFDVCMIDGIWKVFPSRMRLDTAELPRRISIAATRPPPIFLQSTCATTPLIDSLSMTRICSC